MSRSGRLNVALPRQELHQIGQIVDAGEYASAAAVVREAVRAWLHRRTLHAGPHGATRLVRSMQERLDPAVTEPAERVDLLFDAGDAKA
jgi:Arc/MetJ-type ribon-helix-helix transcriptional regulator